MLQTEVIKKINENAPDKNSKTSTLNIPFTIAYTNTHIYPDNSKRSSYNRPPRA
jgi:hypothetical protein